MRFWFPSCFIPASLFEEVGGFNENRKIALDTDWLLRAIQADCKFIYGNHLVSMDEGGISDKYWLRAYDEFIQSQKELGMFHLYDKLVSGLYRYIGARIHGG